MKNKSWKAHISKINIFKTSKLILTYYNDAQLMNIQLNCLLRLYFPQCIMTQAKEKHTPFLSLKSVFSN